MAFTVRKYSSLLRSLSQQLGVDVDYSQPEIVSGSICPPPSRIYPGTVCYMVSVRVDGQTFLGFGPKPLVARQFAEYEAYRALCLICKMSDMTTELTLHHYQNKLPFTPDNCEEDPSVECYFDSSAEILAHSHVFRDDQSATSHKESPSRTSSVDNFEPGHYIDMSMNDQICSSGFQLNSCLSSNSYNQFSRPVGSVVEIDHYSEIPQSNSSRELVCSHGHSEVAYGTGMKKTCRDFDGKYATPELEDPTETVVKLARERNLTVSYEISCTGPPHARLVRNYYIVGFYGVSAFPFDTV